MQGLKDITTYSMNKFMIAGQKTNVSVRVRFGGDRDDVERRLIEVVGRNQRTFRTRLGSMNGRGAKVHMVG